MVRWRGWWLWVLLHWLGRGAKVAAGRVDRKVNPPSREGRLGWAGKWGLQQEHRVGPRVGAPDSVPVRVVKVVIPRATSNAR